MNISKVESYNPIQQNRNRYKQNSAKDVKQQSFTGIGSASFNALDKFFGVLDKNAMIQVSFVDTVSTNIPRTIVDLKTGLAAALETCRREFSGLFVNCLMPGLIVKGIASILPKASELKNTQVVSSWANGKSIDRLNEIYKQAYNVNAVDTTKEFVQRSLTSLKGLDGNKWIEYSTKANEVEFKNAVDNITEAITQKDADKGSLLKSAKEKLAALTKAENVLQFNGKPQANLEETIRDIADLGAKFNTVKERSAKALGKTPEFLTGEELAKAIDEYSNSLKSFVNKKSILGLSIVLGIAVSIQTINRAITRKQFNAEGAPIYSDFGKKDTTQKMNEKEKKEFFLKRLLSAASMYGIAALSMMKKPSLGMFQFSGIFPTLDQCRWIAASTFASRMMAAEDENELRETAIRDIASFAGLYFLGDYAKKGAASFIEAFAKTKSGHKLIGEEVVLLNRKPSLDSANKNGESSKLKQLINWIKNTELKTANEVSSKKVRNLRNLCRVADIAFSITMLGFLLPIYNRKVTEKKVAEAKKQEENAKKAMLNFSSVEKKNTPEIFKNII